MKNAEKGIAMGVINTILTIILPFCGGRISGIKQFIHLNPERAEFI